MTADRWREAFEHAIGGDRHAARRAVLAALAASPREARWAARAARLLLVAGDFAGAVRLIDRAAAAASADERRDVLIARAFASGMLGDVTHALATFEQILDADSPPRLAKAAIELALCAGAPERARQWLAPIERNASATPAQQLCAAEVLRRTGDGARARTIASAVLHAPRCRPEDRRAAAEMLVACGAFDDAAEGYRAQIAAGEDTGAAHLGLATLHLWRGELATAEEHARAAEAAGADPRAAERVRAAAALLAGRIAAARTALDDLVARWPADAETHAWRAEALLRAHDPAEALVEVRLAGDLSPDRSTYLALALIAALADLHLDRRPTGSATLPRAVALVSGHADAARVRRLIRRGFAGHRLWLDRALASGTRWLRRGGIPLPAVAHPREIAATLDDALGRLGGNRTHATPTMVIAGRLVPLALPPPPRAEVKAALHAVRSGGFAEAHRRLGGLIARYPEWPHPLFYRAELWMWVGRLDAARRDLEAALAVPRDPEVERGYWPRIGLAGVQLLEGHPEAAMRTLDRLAGELSGPPAEPYFAWRGEILRGLGRLGEARATLERVCPPGGCRLGAWLTLALTCRDLGDRERSRQILATAAALAPALMLDLAATAGDEALQELLDAPDWPSRASDDQADTVLTRALHAIRGNRSASCLTFVDGTNELRAIPPNAFYRFVDPYEEIAELRTLVPGRR